MLEKPNKTIPLTSTQSNQTQRSILADLGDKSTKGVVGQNFTYDSFGVVSGEYSFSLVNKLREPVNQIYCLIVFYGMDGYPLDVAVSGFKGIIPGGLAKRITGRVDRSVEILNNPNPTQSFPYVPNPPRRPRGQVYIRILDFDLAE